MQQNRKNTKGDEYFCKALYMYIIIYLFIRAGSVLLAAAKHQIR